MQIHRLSVLVAILLLFPVRHAAAQTEAEQRVIAQQLLSDDVRLQSLALEVARSIRPTEMRPELRIALITLLESKNRVVAAAIRRGEPLDKFENPEFVASLSRVVAELNDPRAIPALAEAIYGGFTAARALARFGEQSVLHVVRVVTFPENHYDVANHGLIALRFLVEGATKRPLSPNSLEAIRQAAAQRLTGRQRSVTTLWRAVDLAVVLADPGLLRIVQALASDREAVIARGITDPDLIERTRKHAADRLAGAPPLPACCQE